MRRTLLVEPVSAPINLFYSRSERQYQGEPRCDDRSARFIDSLGPRTELPLRPFPRKFMLLRFFTATRKPLKSPSEKLKRLRRHRLLLWSGRRSIFSQWKDSRRHSRADRRRRHALLDSVYGLRLHSFDEFCASREGKRDDLSAFPHNPKRRGSSRSLKDQILRR